MDEVKKIINKYYLTGSFSSWCIQGLGKWGCKGCTFIPCLLGTTEQKYTANVNSQITDKLMYLSFTSKETNLFSNIYESHYNHKQMWVKINIKITEKVLSLWIKSGKTTKYICMFARICLFPVDIAFGAMSKE